MAGYSWTHDNANRVEQISSTTDGTFTYDDTDQLETGTYTYQTDESHVYDANGNRTGGGYTTGTNNLTTADGTYAYQYDGEGNRTAKFVDVDSSGTLSSGDTDVTQYEWDHRNRLTKITRRDTEGGDATKTVEYVYDAFNRRITKSIDEDGAGPNEAVDQHFVYDGLRESRDNAGDHLVLVFDDADGSGSQPPTLRSRFLHGPAVDQILADEDVNSGEVLWPLTDNLGTVRDLAEYDDTLGVTEIANHITYDTFGHITSESNPAVDHLFGYTGRETDEESDLQFNRARYYDAATGQWISEDPIGFEAGDANLRRYVGNSPTNATDPSGKSWLKKIKFTLTKTGELVFENGKKVKLRNWRFRSKTVGVEDLREAGLQCSASGRARLKRLERDHQGLKIKYDKNAQPDLSDVAEYSVPVKGMNGDAAHDANLALKALKEELSEAEYDELVDHLHDFRLHHASDGTVQVVPVDIL